MPVPAFAKVIGPCPFRLCRLMCGGGCAPPKAAGLVLGYARIRATPADLWGERCIKGIAKCKTDLYGGA